MNICTFTSWDYNAGLVALAYSLAVNGSLPEKTEWTHVYWNSVSDRTIDMIRDLGFQVNEPIAMKKLANLKPPHKIEERLQIAWHKIGLFFLPISETVIYMDADLLCLRSVASLANWEHFTVVPDLGKGAPKKINGYTVFQTSIMGFRPDKALANEIYEHSKTGDFRLADMGLLNDYFLNTNPQVVKYALSEYSLHYLRFHKYPEEARKCRLIHYCGGRNKENYARWAH